jgi:hypothetical protein
MTLGRSAVSLIALVLPMTLAVACGSKSKSGGLDDNNDNVADDLGKTVDDDGDDFADGIDIDHDGTIDGPGVDTDDDGEVDALALDTDCDGLFDSLDTSGDGLPDWETDIEAPKKNVPNCDPVMLGSGGSGGSGGMMGGAGTPSTGGKGGSSGSGGSAGSSSGPSQLGKGQYQGTGVSMDQYAESDVYRNGVGYKFIANGWGMNWGGHNISWNGTSFTVLSLNGSQGSDYSPAGYPTVFCGLYSEKQSVGGCGLPGSIASLASVRTGWRWKANGNNGQYNAAWDIWLGNGNSFAAYLMVWLREPPGQQPAGSAATSGATVPGLPGTWNIWTGQVKGFPIVNYVLDEGEDLSELEFDVMDVYDDAKRRNYNLPGTTIMAVAVGFEVWNGPVTNLVNEDFYVDVK